MPILQQFHKLIRLFLQLTNLRLQFLHNLLPFPQRLLRLLQPKTLPGITYRRRYPHARNASAYTQCPPRTILSAYTHSTTLSSKHSHLTPANASSYGATLGSKSATPDPPISVTSRFFK